jgi:hypothetical protein
MEVVMSLPSEVAARAVANNCIQFGASVKGLTAYRFQLVKRPNVGNQQVGSVPAVGVVEAVDGGRCVLHTGADTVETLAVYLGLLDADFTVDGPPELRLSRTAFPPVQPCHYAVGPWHVSARRPVTGATAPGA